jgi:acyl-CoA thioesterase
MTTAVPVQHSPTAVAAAMHANDTVAQQLNMAVLDVTHGSARVSMIITRAMTNGVGTAHGGYIFTLADTAFAYACNSYNQFAVAADCSIQFLRPAYAGDTLLATATETATAGRTGVYDVLVTRATDAGGVDIIATFRGKSAQVKSTHLPE